MEDEDVFDKLATLIAGADKAEFIASLVEHKIWDDVRDRAIEDAEKRGDVVTMTYHDSEVADLEKQVAEAEAMGEAVSRDCDRLHEAICEGRRQDAIDLLRAITDRPLRSVREQRNLFPDRVPQ